MRAALLITILCWLSLALPQEKDVAARFNRAVELQRQGAWQEAVAEYRALLGIAHYRAGQFAKAVEVLERFLAVAPGHAQARQLIGVSLVELGRDDEAVKYLEPALPAPQSEATALYSLGLAYLRLHRTEVATVVERLAARADGIALSRLLQGQAYLNQLELEKAVAELEA